jgi:hypothetical protein
MLRVLNERPKKPKEYPIGLPHEGWEGPLRRFKGRGYSGEPHFRGSRTDLVVEEGPERPENEVHEEFRDLLIRRFTPVCAKMLAMHVLGGIPLTVAASECGIGRLRAKQELERLREMY